VEVDGVAVFMFVVFKMNCGEWCFGIVWLNFWLGGGWCGFVIVLVFCSMIIMVTVVWVFLRMV